MEQKKHFYTMIWAHEFFLKEILIKVQLLKKTKLYENKSCLLPKFFSNINSRESKKEHILKRI